MGATSHRAPARLRQLAALLALSCGAYGCRLILGIGEATERASDGGPGGPGDEKTVEIVEPETGSDTGAARSCANGWCWENPLPQGQTLNAVWASSPTDIWAVGSGATLHYDGKTFEVKAALTPNVSKITASGATVFALIDQQPSLQIIRFDNDASAWRPSYSGGQQTGPMADLWSVAPDEAWVVGVSHAPPTPGPLVLHLKPDTSNWQSEPFDAGSFQLFSIRGTASNDVWALGQQTMSHWTGSSWSTDACATTLGVSPGECGAGSFLVGVGPGVTSALVLVTTGGTSGAKFHKWSGGKWTGQPSSPSYMNPIRGVAATTNGDVWLMDAPLDTTFVRLRGESFGASGYSLPGRFNAMAAYGASDVIAVGESGIIGRTNGDKWEQWPGTGGSRASLSDLAVTNNLAIGVGLSGPNAVAVRKGEVFFQESIIASTPPGTLSCWSGGANDQWYVSKNIYRWNGKTFEESYVAPTEVQLRQIRGTSASDIWAVGDDFSEGGQRGFAVHYDGSKWTVDSPAGSTQLSAVWIEPVTKVPWVVGPNGSVFRRREGTWARVDPSVGSQQLSTIAGTSSSDVWVAGSQFVAHYDGKDWTPKPPSPPIGGSGNGNWTSLAARAADDVWIVASDRVGARWDGKEWRNLPAAPAQLNAVALDSDGTPWFAGAGGAILRYGR